MMMRAAGPQSRRAAPALRFLMLCLGGWVSLRILTAWNPALPPAPDAVRAPWAPPSPLVMVRPRPILVPMADQAASHASPRSVAAPRLSLARTPWGVDRKAVPAFVRELPNAERHGLRFALALRFLSPMMGSRGAGAMPQAGGGTWLPAPAAAVAAPGHGQPFWMQRPMAGWSLGGWLYLRETGVAAPGGIAAASQLGASQSGVRLAYGFGESGRTRIYGRATAALRQFDQRELAIGLAFAPVARWPVDIAVERRMALGRKGRTATAVMVTGGVSGVALPGDFRLDAYGQAGVVGARRRDGFADGAVVIDRWLGHDEAARLRIGALAAGGIQPGAARVDVGPRLTLRLPHIGEGSRIALDWRQRIIGRANPASGVALTLAGDF